MTLSHFHILVTTFKTTSNTRPAYVLGLCHLSLVTSNTFKNCSKPMQTVCNFILHFCCILLKTV